MRECIARAKILVEIAGSSAATVKEEKQLGGLVLSL